MTLHPSLLSSRRCIPIPHTVAVSPGESCLPSASGRAEPVRTDQPNALSTRRSLYFRVVSICISTSSFAYSKNGERASHRKIQFHVPTRHAQEQEQIIFSHESRLQPRSAWHSIRKPQEHGLHRLSWSLSCHGPHLYTQPLSNRKSWVSTRIYFSRNSIQSTPHPVKWSTSSLHPYTHPIPDSHVPHPQCLSSAEHIRTGSLLHSASVRSSATCDPSHHRGAAQQHPLHSALPRPRPRPRSSQQRHGGHGNGGRDDYGHECRDPVDNTPARSDWSTSSYGANLQAPRDTWLQLRTTSLVEPALRIWSPPSYATA